MMRSHRSEHSHRRQYGDRSSRQWEDYDERREERREPHRDLPRDSYNKYGGDGHSSTERTNRNRQFSDSPKRRYSKDTASKDWGRKSPVRRHVSSPDWGAAEKKRQRFPEDDEDKDYRYRREPEDKTYSHSSDTFSHMHLPKDYKHTLQQEDDFKYRKTSQDSRHRHRQSEESTYRQQHDDYRPSSGYYKERDHRERSWGRSEERTRSPELFTKTCGKSRERNDSTSTDHEDHRQSRTRFPVKETRGQSFESDVPNQSPVVPEQKSADGFQRFLDVLNKGVNVAMLTKIVTQTSPDVSDVSQCPESFMNTADHPWSPSSAGRQQGNHHDSCHWSESKSSQRVASPQPHHRSFSPQQSSLADKSLQRSDRRQSSYSLNSRSRSPSVAEKITLTPEEEHKQRQMQDVLQAIGMDLGFEELGQMSHRIQERLYGKRDSDHGRHRRESAERDTKRALSPKRRSRSSSSSSRSNFSSLTRDSYINKDSGSAQRDVTEVQQAQVHQVVEYVQNGNGNSSSLQDSEKCETNSQETFSQSTTYSYSEPPPPPVMPTYSLANCSSPPYPALPPTLPHALPPNLPHVGSGHFLPRLPPLLPYPHIPPMPPLNIFPAVLAQTRHLLPQHSNPHTPFFNLPNMNQVQPVNTTQKTKTQARPRCLQVIETKQPG